MLKKILLFTITTLLFTFSADATTYTYEINFDDIQVANLDFNLLFDGPWNCQGSVWKTKFERINLNEETVSSGNLSLFQTGNGDTSISTENWLITSFDNEIIGEFSDSNCFINPNNWTLDTWDLSTDILKKIELYNFLPIIFWENTDGIDITAVDKMLLTIDTQIPVPEPTSLFLLGTGILLTPWRKFAFAEAKK